MYCVIVQCNACTFYILFVWLSILSKPKQELKYWHIRDPTQPSLTKLKSTQLYMTQPSQHNLTQHNPSLYNFNSNQPSSASFQRKCPKTASFSYFQRKWPKPTVFWHFLHYLTIFSIWFSWCLLVTLRQKYRHPKTHTFGKMILTLDIVQSDSFWMYAEYQYFRLIGGSFIVNTSWLTSISHSVTECYNYHNASD